VNITIAEAIKSLDSTAEFVIVHGDTDVITWHTTPISDSDITTEQERLQAEYDSQEYARNRKAEYDQLNQFEMQFDDDRDGTTTWVDTINEIKGRYPK
jgi:hypothetical protein